jgi:hypothetical protein
LVVTQAPLGSQTPAAGGAPHPGEEAGQESKVQADPQAFP